MRQEATTRRQRRAARLARFVTAREARWAARAAKLGCWTSGPTGALRVPGVMPVWHLNGRANGYAPRPGETWDRSGPVRTVREPDLPVNAGEAAVGTVQTPDTERASSTPQ
jgi:hypothetical protein